MRFTLRNIITALVAAELAASIAFGQNTPEYAITKSYRTTTTPTIDGIPEEGEWDDAGPWLVVNAENGGAAANDGDEYGGDADASFRFKTMWREDSWETYFLFEITDDIAAQDQPREDRNWERDQIELFLDGTNLEGDDDPDSYVFWNGSFDANTEKYGKFGVSRENLFEGNWSSMTDDQDLWSEFDPDFPLLSVSNTSETGENGNFYIEYGITLEGMFEDLDNNPFEGTPTETAEHIVEDSTAIKFTVAYSDDDDINFETTDRAHALTYYRVEGTEWNDSTGFSDLIFTGEYEGIVCDPGTGGDLDGNGKVEFADFLVLSGNFGNDVTSHADGDIDCNGKVEFADFLVLSGNFGNDVGGAQSVPEPSGVSLLLIGLAAIARRRQRS